MFPAAPPDETVQVVAVVTGEHVTADPPLSGVKVTVYEATAPPVVGAVHVRTGVNEVVPDKPVGAPGTGKGCAVTGPNSFDGGERPSTPVFPLTS
jgi:hypothetical protein